MSYEPTSRPPLRVLCLAVLAAVSSAAWADEPCPAAGTTNGGSEYGDNNTTCYYTDSAFGYMNYASGAASAAFGGNNSALANFSSAFGMNNTAQNAYSSAFGYGNYVIGQSSGAFGAENSMIWYVDYYGLEIQTGEGVMYGNDNLIAGIRNSIMGHGNSIVGHENTASGFRNIIQGGRNTTAVGMDNQIIGIVNDGAVNGDEAFIENASAVGASNVSSANGASAMGYDNTASRTNSSAYGYGNEADGTRATAFGTSNVASVADASAFGIGNVAGASDANAFGQDNEARGRQSSAFGYNNTTLGAYDVALGSGNTTTLQDGFGFAGYNVAVGIDNIADGGNILDFGMRPSTVALGVANAATVTNGIAVGVQNSATALGAIALGYRSAASGVNSVVLGTAYDSDGDGVIDVAGASATMENATALGAGAVASAVGSTAIGAGAVADRADTVSLGNANLQRQLTNLAVGTEDTDAVNLSQLTPVATALGGGAAYMGGMFTAPTYIIQSNNYNDVGSAFAAVDGAIDDINARIVAVGGVQGEQGESAYEVAVSNGFAGTESAWLDSLRGPSGPSGPTGPEGPPGGGPRSVTYDSDARDVLTMAGADGTRIANVADAVEATDAVNLGQMEAGDAETLSAANEYTDNTATETLTSANAYTDQRFAEITGLSDSFESFRNETDRRFQQQDRRIDKLSAMGGAYAGMAMNTAGLAGRNRVGVGVGAQGGEQALAVGYQRAIGNRASVSIAGAFSGDEKSVSAGAGFSW